MKGLAMTNGITVPKQYKGMMRAERDNDQRDADIKLLVQARKNMVITTADFIEATGAISAMLHVKRLMKAGYITRHKVKQAGKRAGYGYKWHTEPLMPKAAIMANGGTVTTSLNLPPILMTDIEHANLHGIFHNWIDDHMPSGDEIVHVRAFIKYIRDQNDAAKQAREKKFNKGATNDN